MLDSFDVMLYSMVLGPLMNDLAISKTAAGAIGSLTLVAAAAGGLAFGVVADRHGRVLALRWSVIIYAIFTAACGLAQNLTELLAFRVLLGLGMGGEWACGAALVSETWPARDRGKALGLMQSSWAIGYALAALTSALVLPLGGWRVVFFVGLAPALLTIWMRRSVKEPDAWSSSRPLVKAPLSQFADLFRDRLGRFTIAITLMNACALFAWWGFNLWIPAYLSLPETQGGLGRPAHVMTALILVMQFGMWLGYVTFGIVSDSVGRKPSYIFYLASASCVLFIYSVTRSSLILFLLGPLVAFFGTGHFAGLGVATAEIYETRIRATAQGFTYNVGRIASAAAPFTVGSWAATRGFPSAFRLAAIFFALAAFIWIWIPETRRE
ncbi:MAG TPA: MFS transporter [Bryobacteraceae bacterium]|jgi:MFS family permease